MVRARSTSTSSPSMTWCASTPDPVLPHPRAHQRAFVLRPLAEVAPAGLDPPAGTQTVEDLIAGLPPQEIALL